MDGPIRDKMLDLKIDDVGVTVRQAKAVQFAVWCLSKINGLKFFDPDVQKISALAQQHPGSEIDEDTKIDYVETLIKLGVVSLQ